MKKDKYGYKIFYRKYIAILWDISGNNMSKKKLPQ